jgi:hypothetical protein
MLPVIVPPIRNGIWRLKIDFRILSKLLLDVRLCKLLRLLMLYNNNNCLKSSVPHWFGEIYSQRAEIG